jgi:hypothetical protein
MLRLNLGQSDILRGFLHDFQANDIALHYTMTASFHNYSKSLDAV